MKIVLDNNILFSIMNPYSITSYLFYSIRAEFFAPEFIITEFEKYKAICLIKSGLSEDEFNLRFEEIKKSIEFIKTSEYKDFLKISKNALEDIDDADFLALAIPINASIWSNDSKLKKQDLAKVYKTQELVEMFLRDEI